MNRASGARVAIMRKSVRGGCAQVKGSCWRVARGAKQAAAMSRRSALAALLFASAIVVFPASAAATISPSVTITQTGTTAGTSPATGFAIDFSPLNALGENLPGGLGGDSVRDLTIAFPNGFLIDLDTDGGACLASSAPSPSCQLGSGTINGPSGTPMSLYLVAPPKASDVAGVAIVV